jgi:anti-anti-sigma factor
MRTDSVVLHEDPVGRIERTTNPPGLRLYGTLDFHTRSILDRELDYGLRDGQDLYVDLSELEFIDVRCMRTLLDVAAHLELDGCRLVLLGPNLAVRRIIRICREARPGTVDVFLRPT